MDIGAKFDPLPALSGRVEVGFGASLTDLAHFEHALQQGRMRASAMYLVPQKGDQVSPVVEALFQPLQHLNVEAQQLRESAARMSSSPDAAATPGEILKLTVLAHEFLFHSQLIANIANRTSDGLQQLLRQQS